MKPTLSIGLLIAAIAVVLTAVLTYQRNFQTELSRLATSGQVRLAEHSSRLKLQIDGFKALANFVATDTNLSAASTAFQRSLTNETLLGVSLKYGAHQVDLVDQFGAIIASSEPSKIGMNVPVDLTRAALNGRLGFDHQIIDNKRLVRLSRAVHSANTDPVVVVISTDLGALEFEWPVTPEPVAYLNDDKIIISANRPELLLLSTHTDDTKNTLSLVPTRRSGSHQLWRLAPPDEAPYEVMVLDQYVTQIDLTGRIFVDTTEARNTAFVRFLLTLAASSIVALIGALALLQRRRLAQEAQHTATLEARVEARTVELRDAQDELVEASKLAALGRLSAGISHEVNQPLAAILNFAKNGQRFIERDEPNRANENLSLIADQVNRITRIIGNLRAFARQEIAPTEQVDFAQATREALTLLQNELAEAQIKTTTHIPREPVYVMAGRVRLEQVILNLLTNAADAMEHTSNKTIALRMTVNKTDVVLTVRDNGTGVKDPDRIFEPFYTTKNLGASQGLGMGLALSFGLIHQFGGQMQCRNLEQGAEFRVTLPLISPHEEDTRK